MGASTFTKVQTGDSADSAFDEAVEMDRHMNGSGPYQGGIGQKNTFRMRRRDPMPRPEALQFASNDVDSYGRDDPAMAIPFFETETETTEIEKRVRVTDPEAAAEEALERAGLDRGDFDNLETHPVLVSKGYTAKLDRTESNEKSVKYEVKRIADSSPTLVDVSPEAAEELPDALFSWGQYAGPEGEYDSFREARSAIMTHFAVLPNDDADYEIHEIKQRTDVTKFSSKRPASEVSTWDVTIKGETYEHPDDPEADGYLFYGWARE